MAHPLPGVTNSTPAGAPAALPGAIAMVTASSYTCSAPIGAA